MKNQKNIPQDIIENYDLVVPQKTRLHLHGSPRSIVVATSHFSVDDNYYSNSHYDSDNESNDHHNFIPKQQQKLNTATNNNYALPDENFDDFVRMRAQLDDFVTMRNKRRNSK